jgi:hypothetical protein
MTTLKNVPPELPRFEKLKEKLVIFQKKTIFTQNRVYGSATDSRMTQSGKQSIMSLALFKNYLYRSNYFSQL